MKNPFGFLFFVLLLSQLNNACAPVPSYTPKSDGVVSEARLLEDFEEGFESLVAGLDENSTREEIASSLLAAQDELQTRYGGAGVSADSTETGRCLLVSGVAMPSLGKNSGIKRAASGSVIYTDYLRKSRDCVSFFQERFGTDWAKYAGSFSVSFFSYTI